MTPFTRRQFLGAAAAGALSLDALAGGGTSAALATRPLGSTGLDVTLLGLGCATLGFGPHSVAEGARIVEAAIDNGITYIDCASSYRNAEDKVGEVMRDRRAEVVLSTKTLERDKEAAWREIHRSLERLQTDHVDLLQIHAVNSQSDLDKITSADGALRSAVRAKEEGLCHHIGITGHTRPAVIAAALDIFPFETVLCPISSTDALVNDFAPVVFPLAQDRRFGVIAMKILAAGKMVDHPADSIRYSLSLPVSTGIVGMGSIEEVKQNVASLRGFRPMNEKEMTDLEERTRPSATTDVLWWKRT